MEEEIAAHCQYRYERDRRHSYPQAASASRKGDFPSVQRDRFARFRIALQPLQLGTYFGGVLITEFTIFLQRTVDDVFQFGWYVGIQPHGRNRCAVQDRIENRCRTVPTEGQLPGGHLIENGSKRE